MRVVGLVVCRWIVAHLLRCEELQSYRAELSKESETAGRREREREAEREEVYNPLLTTGSSQFKEMYYKCNITTTMEPSQALVVRVQLSPSLLINQPISAVSLSLSCLSALSLQIAPHIAHLYQTTEPQPGLYTCTLYTAPS